MYSYIVTWHLKSGIVHCWATACKHIPAEVNVCKNRRVVFSVVCAMLVAIQRCGKHISAAVNPHATIEEAMFSVGTAQRLYNKNLRQLRDRTEGVYGGGSRR
jgi:hypothetical protein